MDISTHHLLYDPKDQEIE
jgi:hypothetical protein